MSALAERLAALAAGARAEAAEAEAKLPETAALARAGALLAKRVPDKLIAAARAGAADGTLERLLREVLPPDHGDLAFAVGRRVLALLEQQAEACGEELLTVTDASVRLEASLRSRAAALREKAEQMDALLSSEERPPSAEATSGTDDPPRSRERPVPNEGRAGGEGTT